MISVCCVLKTGGDFDWRYVRILRDSVAKWWPDDVPYKFVVLTDQPKEGSAFGEAIELKHSLPGWWSKVELFRPDVTAHLGDRLFFDLDTAITGPLDDVAAWCVAGGGPALMNNFTVLEDFYRPGGYGSGMMFIPMGYGDKVWSQFLAEAGGEPWIERVRGDQDFLEVAIPRAVFWQNLLPKQICSFKPVPIVGAQLSKLPKGTNVVCFHGHPRPHELAEDHWIRREHWRPHLKTIDGGKDLPDYRDPTMTWEQYAGVEPHNASDGI